MKIVWLTLLLVCLAAFSVVAQSQQDDYQQGKIISIKKLPPGAPYEGDASMEPLQASVTRYNVSTQVGDTIYVYQYKVETGEGVPWDVGQTQQVKPKGYVMHVKGINGQDATYSIVGRSKATTQSPQ
jgi:hypothetical protein